jgi:hypothetical protein
MYKPSLLTYLAVNLFSYISTYIGDTSSYRIGYQGETKILTQVEVHPQRSKNRHPVDGALVGGCWFTMAPRIN